MPTSHLYQLNEITELIVLTRPKSLLDIGVGFGKYGFLAREFLDVFEAKSYAERKTRIDGIEGFQPYLTPVHGFIYDHVYTGNAIDLLPSLETKYDLILLIDVLEHFNHDTGMRLLDECMDRGRNIIISTPKDIGSQTDCFGNPLETHRFQWRKLHLEKFAKKFFVPNMFSLVCYIGDDAQRVREKRIPRIGGLGLEVIDRLPFLRGAYRRLKNKD